jgi:hypothetical protein
MATIGAARGVSLRLFSSSPVNKHQFWDKQIGVPPNRGNLVPPQTRPSLVDEIVPFREKISNQRALNDRNALNGVLPWARMESSGSHDEFPLLCILEVHHQRQVLSVPPYSTANVIRLADIKSLETAIAAAPAKYINPGRVR